MIHGQGPKETTEFGAIRESNAGRGRFDLLPFEALESLAKWYELGAEKYGDRNWEEEISVKDCINRMIRHSIKDGNGWTDEDHLSAVMWNAAAAITMMQRRPDCNDHPWLDSPKPEKQKKPLSGRYPWKKGCPVLIARNNHVIQLEELENFCIEEGGPILAAFDDLKMAIKARHKEKEALSELKEQEEKLQNFVPPIRGYTVGQDEQYVYLYVEGCEGPKVKIPKSMVSGIDK